MAQPTRTGTAQRVDLPAGGSTTITVPADCTLIVCLWSFWDGGGGRAINQLDIGSGSEVFTLHTNVGDSGDFNGGGAATLKNPTTGSQTFTVDWTTNDSMNEGGSFFLIYVKGEHATTPYHASSYDRESGSANVSTSVASTSTDLVLVQSESAGGSPGGNSTVFLNDSTFNSNTTDLSDIDAVGASTTTVDMTGEFYAWICAISISEAAGAGTTYYQSTSGSVTAAGSVSKKLSRTIAGVITATSALGKKTSRSLSGVVTAAGSLALSTGLSQLLTGSITATGSLSRKTARTLSGAIAATGSVFKKTAKTMQGSIALVGGVTTAFSTFVFNAGVITISGLLSTLWLAPPAILARVLQHPTIRRMMGRR